MSLSIPPHRQMVPSLVQDLLDHIARLEKQRGIGIEDSPETKKLFSLANRLQTAVDAGIKINQPNSRWNNLALDELEADLEQASDQVVLDDDLNLPSAALSAVRHFRAQFNASWAWRIALCSLTPGGSEYTTPDACVAFVREARSRDATRFKSTALRNKELEGQLTKALLALTPFAEDAANYDRPDYEDIDPAHGQRTVGDYRRAKALVDGVPLPDSRHMALTEDAIRRRSEAAIATVQARSREMLLTEIARRCSNPSHPDLVDDAALRPEDRVRAASILAYVMPDAETVPPDMERAEIAFVDAAYDRADDPPDLVLKDQIRAAVLAGRAVTDLTHGLIAGDLKARIAVLESEQHLPSLA